MGPVVKRLKKSIALKKGVASQHKKKSDKTKKSISPQKVVSKIKRVNKHAFDPIKANRGVVLLKNIPHGFYEDEMRKYFGQFGLVTRVRLARSQRTGRSKGFAYIEFSVPEVAKIAADTMNNYMMFKHVLKTVYIPPEKQTFNYFRKDVTFITNSEGERSFSSDKTESIQKEIERINRIPTDEEHAKRMKRTMKKLRKQEEKYGIDLSHTLVSGFANSSKEEPSSALEASETEEKSKKATKDSKTNKSKVQTTKENQIIAKKEKKKQTEGGKGSTESKSLLGELLNETYDTDTSDEDFKIDHSFNVSGEDSDNSSTSQNGLADLMAPKLSAAFMKNEKLVSESDDDDDTTNSEDEDTDGEDEDTDGEDEDEDTDGEDEDENVNVDEDDDVIMDDDENEGESTDDDEPSMDIDEGEKEFVSQLSKDGKKSSKGGKNNGTKPTGKAFLKRKLNESSDSSSNSLDTSNSSAELEIQAKKKKPMNKKENLSGSDSSKSKLEASGTTKQKKQQKNAESESTSTTKKSIASEAELKQIGKKRKTDGAIVTPMETLANKKSVASDAESKQTANKQKKCNVTLKETLGNAKSSSSEAESKPHAKKQKNGAESLTSKKILGKSSTSEGESKLPTQKQKNSVESVTSKKALGKSSSSEESKPPAKKQKNGAESVTSKNTLEKSTSPEAESKPHAKKQKKGNVTETSKEVTLSPTFSSPEVEKNIPAKNQKKRSSSSSGLSESTETGVSKKKLIKKKVKTLKDKKNPKGTTPDTTSSELDTPKREPSNKKSKKTASNAKGATSKIVKEKSTTSAANTSEEVKQKSKKTSVIKEKFANLSIESSLSNPELEKSKLKKNKKPSAEKVDGQTKKPLTLGALLTNGNVKTKLEPTNETADSWTESEETKKPKANLKTIVRKKNSKKQNDLVNVLDVKKVKATPNDLLQIVPSKVFKQKLQSKKKSK